LNFYGIDREGKARGILPPYRGSWPTRVIRKIGELRPTELGRRARFPVRFSGSIAMPTLPSGELPNRNCTRANDLSKCARPAGEFDLPPSTYMKGCARIVLSGPDARKIDGICKEIREIARRRVIGMSGPVPLPTKHLRVPVRKGPDGGGSSTIDHWELRIHKRLIDLDPDDRALRQVMRIRFPDGVSVEIVLLKG
jgi:small subunit ribosomal protein S10